MNGLPYRLVCLLGCRCHPETRVIVPHQRGQLVYLGARHLPSHREVFPEDLPVPGLDPPRRYELTSEKDCLEMAAKMPFSKVRRSGPLLVLVQCVLPSCYVRRHRL